jgi:transposase InsO family protein
MQECKAAVESATNRYKALTPVLVALDEKADAAKLTQVKRHVCEQAGISERTLRRWMQSYQKDGFDGLKPIQREKRLTGSIPSELIEEAIMLRREVPGRSISQIIEILEMEGRVGPGVLKRTTLQEKLAGYGYSARQMKMYRQGGLAARRFVRISRNDMWHSDIKYGPFITEKGRKKQIYMVTFLDDATRYVVHGEFYDSIDQSVVEDCFRKAVMKEGLPQRVYFDNGKQYRTKWMERACAILDIKLLYAKPYSPESTGKIERFNRTAEKFLDEVRLKKPLTLGDYNEYFKVWLAECYHNKKHAGLGGDTPEAAYKRSAAALRFLPPETVASAFMHCEQRKVDKSGCISFNSKKYEVGITFIGQIVDIVFDPADTQQLMVEHRQSGTTFPIKELTIGEHTGPRPKLPSSLLYSEAPTSRLLDAKERQYRSRREAKRNAIRYSGFGKEGGENNV